MHGVVRTHIQHQEGEPVGQRPYHGSEARMSDHEITVREEQALREVPLDVHVHWLRPEPRRATKE